MASDGDRDMASDEDRVMLHYDGSRSVTNADGASEANVAVNPTGHDRVILNYDSSRSVSPAGGASEAGVAVTYTRDEYVEDLEWGATLHSGHYDVYVRELEWDAILDKADADSNGDQGDAEEEDKNCSQNSQGDEEEEGHGGGEGFEAE